MVCETICDLHLAIHPTECLSTRFVCVQAVPAVFPPRGEVEFRNVVMAYRPSLPSTLRGVSFTVFTKHSVLNMLTQANSNYLKVPAGQSLGICGRTAAGKSSLLVALFRIVRLETDGDENKDIALQIVRIHANV